MCSNPGRMPLCYAMLCYAMRGTVSNSKTVNTLYMYTQEILGEFYGCNQKYWENSIFYGKSRRNNISTR